MKIYSKLISCSLAVLLFASPLLLQAQSDQEEVKAAISKMFDAMRNADSAGVRSAFSPAAHMETIAKTKEKLDTVRSNTVESFASSIAKQKAGALDERITFASVLLDGNLAHVWTPYQFYLNGNFSHCGVNSFELVKLNGAWKIQYIIDTRRKDGCN